jgi:hypothetical protein
MNLMSKSKNFSKNFIFFINICNVRFAFNIKRGPDTQIWAVLKAVHPEYAGAAGAEGARNGSFRTLGSPENVEYPAIFLLKSIDILLQPGYILPVISCSVAWGSNGIDY